MRRRLLLVLLALVCVGGTGCHSFNFEMPDISTITSSIGLNLDKETTDKVQSDLDDFLKEHELSDEDKKELEKQVKQWAKIAIDTSGKLDSAKGSLKQWLASKIDELGVENSSDVSGSK